MKENQRLKITDDERVVVNKNMNKFCALGNEKIKSYSSSSNIDTAFDEMPEDIKLTFTIEVLNDGLVELGIRKAKPVKNKKDFETVKTRYS